MSLKTFKGDKGKKRKGSRKEISKLFKEKSKPVTHVWKHKFVCLAHVELTKIPTTEFEKDELLKAGLGEKEIAFDDINISAEEFPDVLIANFPGLKAGGVFAQHKAFGSHNESMNVHVIIYMHKIHNSQFYFSICMCTDEDIGCTLEDMLIFFSGTDALPPLGFDTPPTLTLLHGDVRFPTASTCGIHLSIPTKYKKFEDFKDAMITALLSNDGFGGV